MSEPLSPALMTAPPAEAAAQQSPVRRIVGTALIWVGALIATATAGATVVQYVGMRDIDPLPVLAGYALYLAGWAILPAAGWRRPVAAVIGFLALWLYLHTFPGSWTGLESAFGLAGGGFQGSLVGSAIVQATASTGVVAAWLIARRRRGVAYIALAPVWLLSLIAAIVLILNSRYSWPVPFVDLFLSTPLPVVVGVAAGVLLGWTVFVAGGVWLAVGLERWIPVRAARPVSVNGGIAPVAGTRTNTLAILALVFGIGGGILGIVFGHVARSQIRRSGEQGWGLATAGLVLGYIGLAAGVLILIVYLALIAALLG